MRVLRKPYPPASSWLYQPASSHVRSFLSVPSRTQAVKHPNAGQSHQQMLYRLWYHGGQHTFSALYLYLNGDGSPKALCQAILSRGAGA